jgi:hypothetical protein
MAALGARDVGVTRKAKVTGGGGAAGGTAGGVASAFGRGGGGGGQSLTVRPPTPQDLTQMGYRDGYQVIPAAQTSGGGGGGFATAAAAPVMTLDDFIKNDFFYNQQLGENERLLSDYDAESLRLQQQTEAQQALQRQYLADRLADMGVENAGNMAANGLLRSGLTFKKQDRINEYGVQQENDIAQTLTDLLGNRQSGRVQQEAANRAAVNNILNQLAQRFNASQQIA